MYTRIKYLNNPSARIVLVLVASLLISNCGVRPSDVNSLKSENDSLLQLLDEQDSLLMKLQQPAKVSLSNSLVDELTSKFTRQAYDIYVSFPYHYQQSGKKYPVLVVLDAEVNFGAVSYIVQRLIKDELIPELFVVGIAYRGETSEEAYYSIRCQDFTPSVDQAFVRDHNYKAGSGGAEDFIKFISSELFPFLTNKYPIQEEDKSLYGHSFGGLFGFHALLNHPKLFDNYLLLSPSLWWNKSQILKHATSLDSKPLKLYVGTGALEGDMVNDQLEMVELLKQFHSSNLSIKSEILENETHRTVFGRGFTDGLRFLYKKPLEVEAR